MKQVTNKHARNAYSDRGARPCQTRSEWREATTVERRDIEQYHTAANSFKQDQE